MTLMFNSNTPNFSLADIAAVTGNNDGFGNGNGLIWLLVILFVIGGWGFGGYRGAGGQVGDNYVLTSDFSQLSRQIDNGFSEQRGQGIQLANGLSSLGYEQLSRMNGISTSIMSTGNAIQSQLAQCCCDNKAAIADTKYADAMNANATQNAINSGFCQTNFNNQTNTRDIIDAQRNDTQAILAKLDAMENSRKDEKIAEQACVINNQYLLSQINKNPVPAYWVPNPNGCNCGNVNPYGYYGTTIA